MRKEHWKRLYPLVVDASIGLFAACGVELHLEDTIGSGYVGPTGMAAFIGFAGPEIRGSLVVTTSIALLQRAHPMSQGGTVTVPESDLRDWLCELSNQLLGRLKCRLLNYGVAFDLSTPSCLLGRDLRVEGEDLVAFRAAEAAVYVRMEMELSPARFMSLPPQEAQGHAHEGDLMLFE